MRHFVMFCSLAVVGFPVLAQTMNAENFYQRAVKLKAKGAMAMFNMGEVKALMNEGKAAGLAARDRRVAAKSAGKTPRYCPPQGVTGISSEEFMQRLGAIPQADRRRIDMTEATNRIMEAKYPCSRG